MDTRHPKPNCRLPANSWKLLLAIQPIVTNRKTAGLRVLFLDIIAPDDQTWQSHPSGRSIVMWVISRLRLIGNDGDR